MTSSSVFHSSAPASHDPGSAATGHGSDETRLVHAGRNPAGNHGIVNPPVYHASTVLFPDLDTLEARSRQSFEGVYYGRFGTPTSFAFEEAVTELEGGYRAITTSSGLGALAVALTAFTKAGDHILVADSVYFPTRKFCDRMLQRYGVTVEYYDPLIGAGIGDLIRPETTLVYLESPGSLTFEMQDIPAIVAAVRARETSRRIVTMFDNTWATPLFFKPLQHGVNLSIHSATKYITGHADAMLGVVVADEESFHALKSEAVLFGQCAGPDDIFFGLRGLRTLSVRLHRHQESGLALAEWLKGQPEVSRVLHPGLPEDAGHALWRRDCTGASGLFAMILHPVPRSALQAMVDHMELFGMGYSWGGFESLLLPANPTTSRTATRWTEEGQLIRVHAGLEAVDDLIRDLEAGFQRLRRAL